MEAIAAIGLAANILQFINFVGNVLSTSENLYHSKTGFSSEHEEKIMIIRDLKAISSRIECSTDLQNQSTQNLCSRCNEVSGELLAALTSLQVGRKRGKIRTLCKALRSSWSQEKIARFESRLVDIRQELGLHILFEMKAQQSLSSDEGRRYLTMLDQATKQGLAATLAALQDNSDRIIEAIDKNAGDSQKLHLERQIAMSQQIDALANTVSQHNEQARANMASQRAAHVELIGAIEHATASNADSILNASDSVRMAVKVENVDTRLAITDIVRSNHEVMKQEINELQHGLQKLQIEIGKKVDELKDLVLKINSTAEETERRLLRKRGNTVTVTLMSLDELYGSLQELLDSLLQKGHVAVKTVTNRTTSNILRARAYIKILTSGRRDDDTTLQMYYAWYYAPYFEARFPGNADVQLFEKSAMERWSLELSKSDRSSLFLEEEVTTNSDRIAPSPEYLNLAKLAVQGDALTWILVGLAGAVYSCLPRYLDVCSVLALTFSIRRHPPLTDDPYKVYRDRSMNEKFLIQELLRNFSQSYWEISNYSNTPQFDTNFFQHARYNPKSALGKQLKEDIRLWLQIAADSGLSRILDAYRGSRSEDDDSDIAFALLGLLMQDWPWVARILPSMQGRSKSHMSQTWNCLWIGSEARIAIHFLHQLQAAGINIDFDEDDVTKTLTTHPTLLKELTSIADGKLVLTHDGKYRQIGSLAGEVRSK